MPAKRKLMFTTPSRRTRARRAPSVRRSTVRRRYAKKGRGRRGKRVGPVRGKFVMYNRLLQHKVRTKLIYCDTKTINPSTTSDREIFRLNNINDPEFGLGGHQPAYHDKWSVLYTHYRVLGCKFTITASPHRVHNTVQVASTGTAAGEAHGVADPSHADQYQLPGILFWEISDSGSAQQTESTDLNVIRETASRSKNVGYRMTGTSPNRSYRMSGYCNLRAVMDDVADYNTHTNFFANPVKEVYLHVGGMSKDGTVMAPYRFDIKLEYICELTDPKDAENEN